MELQADCYAGIWGIMRSVRATCGESGDVEEALAPRAAVGRRHDPEARTGYVVPESFTHGSAAPRQQWFSRGFQSGQVGDAYFPTRARRERPEIF